MCKNVKGLTYYAKEFVFPLTFYCLCPKDTNDFCVLKKKNHLLKDKTLTGLWVERSITQPFKNFINILTSMISMSVFLYLIRMTLKFQQRSIFIVFTPGLCLVFNRYSKYVCGNKMRKIQENNTLTQFVFEIPSTLFDLFNSCLGGKYSEE